MIVCRDYISDFCIRVADNWLLSSYKNLLQVQRPSTKFGECSFSVAGLTAWNCLPNHMKNTSSLENFKSHLKTHLFKQLYDCLYCLCSCSAPFLQPLLS